MAEILETCMMLAFGAAWPASILKSLRARTARGKSLQFLIIILVGYSCGMASKIAAGRINYVLIFYALNFVLVSIDVLLYFRNQKFDRMAARV